MSKCCKSTHPWSVCVNANALLISGDFVDRGAWGLEVLVVLACWKLVHPKHVIVLRGNHECTTCTHMYGFRAEVLAKYGPKAFKVQSVLRVCCPVISPCFPAAILLQS